MGLALPADGVMIWALRSRGFAAVDGAPRAVGHLRAEIN